ncbi:MAG: glutathione-disulfide reductase [Acidobacteriota bacterium]
MSRYDYDLFVIGAGSGGVRASRVCAGMGQRVAVAEDGPLGGTCVNVGCVPKKLLVYASHFREEIEIARGYGFDTPEPRFDWAKLIDNKTAEIERLNGIYVRLLENAGVDLIRGRAKLVSAHEVEVAGKTYSAENILVAVGGAPRMPEIPGVEHAISSNEVFYLPEQPKRIVVVGGGYIATEFAGVFNGLGSEVTQLYRGPLFLRGFDLDVRMSLTEEMRGRGIDLRFDSCIDRIEPTGTGFRVALSKEHDAEQLQYTDEDETLEVDQVLYAIGRDPLTADLGLETAGVDLGSGGQILVDEYSRTSCPSVWAIGDVTDRLNLTPVAIHEAMCLAQTLYGDGPVAPDHETVPTAVFSQPEIGTVGLTEEEAIAKYGEVDIYRSHFRALKLTMTDLKERTLMKLVVDRASQKVVGAHMLGGGAGEILQGIGIAVKMGATKQQFDATVGIHPTAAEEFVTMREPVA